MIEAQAEELGRQAFRHGKACSPLADPQMYAELEHAAVGEKTHLMAAFNHGWHAENLATDPSTT